MTFIVLTETACGKWDELRSGKYTLARVFHSEYQLAHPTLPATSAQPICVRGQSSVAMMGAARDHDSRKPFCSFGLAKLRLLTSSANTGKRNRWVGDKCLAYNNQMVRKGKGIHDR